jgi:hypothetical protein
MANFIEYASKAQEELNGELQKLSKKEAELAEKAKLLASHDLELEKRQAELAEKETEYLAKKEELSLWEGKRIREENVQVMFDEANRKEVESQKRLKDAQDAVILADQKLAELSKRELALSEKEKTYKDDVMKEMMQKMLGR